MGSHDSRICKKKKNTRSFTYLRKRNHTTNYSKYPALLAFPRKKQRLYFTTMHIHEQTPTGTTYSSPILSHSHHFLILLPNKTSFPTHSRIKARPNICKSANTSNTTTAQSPINKATKNPDIATNLKQQTSIFKNKYINPKTLH